MISRRALFGLGAGAAAAAAGVKAAPATLGFATGGLLPVERLPLVGEVTSQTVLSKLQIDAMVKALGAVSLQSCHGPQTVLVRSEIYDHLYCVD